VEQLANMKILRIYTRLPPLKGGMEKHIYNLTNEQNKLGHEVSVYFNKGTRISSRDVQISKLSLETKPRVIGIIVFYILITLKLFLKKEKFDVIHIHGDWSSLVFAKLIKKLTKANVLAFSIHDDIKDSFLYKVLISKLLKPVDVIFSTGYAAAKKIEMFTKKKVIVQPSGINKIFFESKARSVKDSDFTVITVANLVPKKNLNLVLDIAKELPSMNFIIVGEGNEREKLQSRIDLENISNLKLLGYKSPLELNTLYRQSNIFLLTSFKEGTPTSILEAMACGLPIVSSNAGDIKNIIRDDVNGFILDNWVKQKYINILLKFQNKSFVEIRKNNIEYAKEYKWEYVSSQITNVLRNKI